MGVVFNRIGWFLSGKRVGGDINNFDCELAHIFSFGGALKMSKMS